MMFQGLLFGSWCSETELVPVPLEVGLSTVAAVKDLHIDVWLYDHAEEGVCDYLPYYEESVTLHQML